MKKFLKFIFDFIAVIIVILAILVIFLSLSTDKSGVTNIGGYIPIKIESDLMEPTLMDNDLIFDQTIEDIKNLKVNDVITFFAEENKQKIIKTERIAEINTTGDSPIFMTKGDNESEISKVYTSDIIGIFINKRMPYAGAVLSFLQTQNGFLICIILPLAILFIYQLFKFIQAIIKSKKQELEEEQEESNEDEFITKEKSVSQEFNTVDDKIAPPVIEEHSQSEQEIIEAPIVVEKEPTEDIEIL